MISDTVPEQLRSQMLIVQVRTNPEVSKKVLRANEQNGLYEASQLSETIFKEVGIEATFEGKGYRLEDYLDGRHLSASGGEKLSAALAKKIIELNRKNISRQQTSRSP
jgi:lysophospholipase L1-like esterase